MNRNKIIVAVALLLCTVLIIRSRWKRRSNNSKQAFTTALPTKTTIKHTITTTGTLRIKDSSRVGSLVAGTVLEILVKENQHVEKGQLLAILDNGKGDTAIRSAQGNLIRATAEHTYMQTIYQREKALFDNGHRAPQEIEQHQRNLQNAHGTLLSAQAARDAAQIEFDNTHIRSPDSGIIIAIGIQKGFRVATDLNATVLFEIARDVTAMEAEVAIDESDIAHVKRGQKVTFTVDSYDHKQFKAVINDISYAPTKNNNGLSYRAIIEVSNQEQLLRPGMTIHATVKINKAKEALGIDTQAFYLDDDIISTVAQQLGFTVTTVPAAEKKTHARSSDDIKYIWTHCDKEFCEKAICIGTQNDRYIQACRGIGPDEHYLTDVEQVNEFDKHYKKMFRGAL